MLMSFDMANAEGTGTQDDPYTGSVYLYIWELPEDIYVLIGTELTIVYNEGPYGGGPIPWDSSYGLELGGNMYAQTIEGVASKAGVCSFDDGLHSLRIHIIQDVEELVFESNPITNGVVEYVS